MLQPSLHQVSDGNEEVDGNKRHAHEPVALCVRSHHAGVDQRLCQSKGHITAGAIHIVDSTYGLLR